MTVAPNHRPDAGVAVAIAVGPANGLDQHSVASCDNITTIRADLLGRHIGALLPSQEDDLTAAILAAFDLT